MELSYFIGIVGVVVTIGAAIVSIRFAVKANETMQEAQVALKETQVALENIESLTENVNANALGTFEHTRKINDEVQESIHDRHKALENIGELIAYFFVATEQLKTANLVYFVNFAFRFGEAHKYSTDTIEQFFEAMSRLAKKPEYSQGIVNQIFENNRDNPTEMLCTVIDLIHTNLVTIARRANFKAVLLDEGVFLGEFLSRIPEEQNSVYRSYSSLRDPEVLEEIVTREKAARADLAYLKSRTGQIDLSNVKKIPMQFICGRFSESLGTQAHPAPSSNTPSSGGPIPADQTYRLPMDQRDNWMTVAFFVGSHSLFSGVEDGIGEADRPSKAVGVFTRTSRYALVCAHLFGWLTGQSVDQSVESSVD